MSISSTSSRTSKSPGPSTTRPSPHSLKFLYEVTLERPGVLQRIRCPKQPKKLPIVLSTDETARFFAAILGVKHRAILMTAYAAGLRVFKLDRPRNTLRDLIAVVSP